MTEKHDSGCMVCGAELVYLEVDRVLPCAYCGERSSANASCAAGHFVCDGCHTQDATAAIEAILCASPSRDLIALLTEVKRHPAVPMHGPQYHGIVPGVILTALRNGGAPVEDAQIRSVIRRGVRVPGGLCGFAGACGAALGAGIAVGAVIGASPVKATERQLLHAITGGFLAKVGEHRAARCCQRDSVIVLREVARRSLELFGHKLSAETELVCQQLAANAQCLGPSCPLHPTGDSGKQAPSARRG